MSLVGIILAGGKSTRMKQDKALLKLQRTTLLQHQFDMLEKHLGTGKVFVSGDRPEYPHVIDGTPNLGPLEGVRSVCSQLQKEGQDHAVLVLPVDMPFVCDDSIRRLIEHCSEMDVIKYFGYQLPAKFRSYCQLIEGIEILKAETLPACPNAFSFKGLFHRFQVEEISAGDDKFFTNLNTPEDWNAAIS